MVGKKVSSKDYQKIKTDENRYSIKTKALNFLSFRPRSTKEVEISLLKKGFDKESISIVLDELIKKKYLNDEDFARTFAMHLIKNKMLGKIAVYNRFFIHQIEQDMLNSILDELYEKYQPKDLIKKIVEKKGFHDNINPIKDRKIVDHLKRKGFSWREISSALNS